MKDPKIAKAAREAQQKKADNEHKALINAVRRIAATDYGRTFLRSLMHECGFLSPSVVVDPHSTAILVDNTVYNEARRNLYLNYRKMMTSKQLIKIEHEQDEHEEIDAL